MKNNIILIGAGEAGLVLGSILAKEKINVTIYTNKSKEEIYGNYITSSQVHFGPAIDIIKRVGLPLNETALLLNKVNFNFYTEENNISFCGYLDNNYCSIDQRIRIPTWIDYYHKLGGKIVHHNITVSEINQLAKNKNNLVIVCGGATGLKELFQIDLSQTPFKMPKRILNLCLFEDPENTEKGLNVNLYPTEGEIFSVPTLSKNGMANSILIESIPGGQLENIFKAKRKFISNIKNALEQFAPHLFERLKDSLLVDEKSFLSGSITPTVRFPFKRLENEYILGIGDCICLTDPIAGQGANNAIKTAQILGYSIIQNLNNLGLEWAQKIAIDLLKSIAASTTLSNSLLDPPNDALRLILCEASLSPAISNFLANSFAYPEQIQNTILEPSAMDVLINNLKETTLNDV